MRLSLSVPPSFCLKSCPHAEDSVALEAERKAEQLKTKRLKEYTVQSHSSVPQNNTYANFERFAQVVEDMGLMDVELSEVEGARHALQGDIEALLSIYNDKESWYKEESETARKQLSQIRYEFRKVEATRKLLQEDVKGVDASLEGISGKYRQRQSQLDTLRRELNSELRWLQDVMGSGSAVGGGGGLTTGMKQALKALKQPLAESS